MLNPLSAHDALAGSDPRLTREERIALAGEQYTGREHRPPCSCPVDQAGCGLPLCPRARPKTS